MTKSNRSTISQLGILLTFVTIFLMATFLSGCTGESKPKVYRVGMLAGLSFITDIEKGFRDGMAELGYVEGENIEYDVQVTDFDIPTYQSVLQQFVADEVDVIVSFPTEATLEALAITEGTDIPVVFTFANIDGLGIINSVQEPGGNVTGVRYPGVDIAMLRYEMMREIMPDVKRIVIPYQAGYPVLPPQLEAVHAAAEKDGVTILELPASSPEEITNFFEELTASGDPNVDAIFTLVDPLVAVQENFDVIADFGREYQVPFFGVYITSGDYAGVFGVNADIYGAGLLTAPLVDKVLQGTDAGTIPVVSAEPYIEIDYAMAQAMGLEIPDSLLAKADQIYR